MTDPQLNRQEAARVTYRLTQYGADLGEPEGDLSPWQARWILDREVDAALMADNLTHGHRRERMPENLRAKEDAADEDAAQLRRLARLAR